MHKVPQSHSRKQIETLVADLTKACEAHGGTQAEKVKAFSEEHAELLHSYPMLYRSICRGTLRDEVLKNLLDARDQLEQGVDKKTALDALIVKAVDDVNAIKAEREKIPAAIPESEK